MHTLEELKSGKLKGLKRLKIETGLTEFPIEIYSLAETLEILDLTGNKLKNLPDDFHRLKNLKILFLSENNFTKFPSVLGKCTVLEMIGFKANQITEIEENTFPEKTKWLILTNNKIKKIPSSIGKCTRLQKCMLAGNELSSLPSEMQSCKNLELLRISANKFEELPSWLFELPKLTWLACAGNPAFENDNIGTSEIEQVDWQKLKIGKLLGQGASGLIYKVELSNKKEAALKIFKGELTSDGLPEDELKASKAIPTHPNLVKIIGELHHHPENKKGLIMELIPSNYINLANPPSLESCTRDIFTKNISINFENIVYLSRKMISVANHLIQHGILHGDFYAHNTLIDENFNPLFGDFGAALLFDKSNEKLKTQFEKIEVRAFGIFMDDLISNVNPNVNPEKINALKSIINICLHPVPTKRPSFTELEKILMNN